MDKLEDIVKAMIAAGESEENIKIVIENYKAEELDAVEPAKTEAVATETAPVTAVNEAVDTELPSEDGLSDVAQASKLDVAIDEISKLTKQKEPTQYYKEKSTELKQNITEMEKQLKAYTDKGGVVDPRDEKILQDYKNELSTLDTDKLGVKERLSNAASNILPQLEMAWESTKALGIDWLSKVAGEDAADFILEEEESGPIVFIDPETQEEVSYKKNPQRFRELNGSQMKGEPVKAIYQNTKKEVGEAADEYIINKFKEIKTLESSIKEVGSITKGVISGDVEETIGGVINAVSSLATTIIPAALTRGASLAPQIIAPMYSDFNLSKAELKYPDSEDPVSELIKNEETEVAIPIVLGGLSMSLESIGLKGITKQISKKTGKLAPFANLILTNHKEGLTEVAQFGVENINKNLAKGLSTQEAFIKGLESMASLDALENYAQGFVGSGIISSPTTITKALNGQPNSLKVINDNIDKLGNLQRQRASSTNKAFRKAIDLEIQETESKLKDHFTENYYVSKSFSNDQQKEITSIINQKEKNNKTIEDLETSFKAGEINKSQYGGAKSAVVKSNNKLSDEIDRIRSEVNKSVLEENINKSTKAFEKVEGVNIEALENADAIESFIKDNNLDIDKKAFKQQGFIIQNKETGEQTIVINKEVAAKEGAVNVAAHEFLHGLLFKTVKDRPEAQIALGESLQEYLNKIDAKQVRNSDFAKRLELYKEDPKNVKAEEVITLFSDALATGDIEFNENIFIKIGDVIRRTLQAVGVKVKFNNGRDVYNFVKDYNNSISKGKLSKAQLKATKTGVKGKLVSEKTVDQELTIKESKTNKELGNEIKALVPEGTSKSRYDNQVIGKVYEKLVFGKTLDGLINGQLNKYGVVGDNVYGKPKDIFLEDVKAQLYEKSLMRFNPETNDDLGGFVVNELIKYRIGDVVNRYKKEAGVEGKSLDVAAGEVGSVQEVADESMSIEEQIDLADTEARSETRLTKATKIMSKEQYDKAAKMVEEKLKDIDPKKLSYKKIGGLATDVLSEITNVPAGKILDSTKNLSKEETSRGAMFIEKNIDYIRKTLPKGAVQEAATEKLMGTATGVANSILKRLYDKNPRIKKGAGLSPWSLKQGITNQDILDAIGRPKREDDKKIQIDPRSPEGQVIKGILNLVDRNIANELARTVESDLTLEQKQDIAAGKSSTMFSKSVNKNLYKNNENYVNFRKLIKDREIFHGGSETTSSEATWFYLDDAEAAEMWGDGKVYKAKVSSLDDYLIIPDLNDVSEYHKYASKKFNLPEDAFYDIREILKLSNAEEVISDWINWTTDNETDWDLGYNLYEEGDITNGAAVTVIGKIPESSLELAQDDINKDESISNVIFNDEVALENNIDPNTLTGVLFSKNLKKDEIELKSKLIDKRAEKAWIKSQGDKELFYALMNTSLRKTTLKNKKLQRNIRRIPNATSTRGNLTEYFQWYKLNDNIALMESLGIKKLIPKKWNSKNDIEAEFEDGSIEGIEVKMSWEDIMGSTSMHYDFGKEFNSVKHDDGIDKLGSIVMDSINKNSEAKKLANEGLENAAKLEDVKKNSNGEVSYPFVIQSETEAKARINRDNLNRPIFNTIEMNVDQVIEHYTKKNVGLIIIGNEIFYIQDKRNKFKNATESIKKLNTKAVLQMRIKPSGIKYSPRFKKYIDTYSLVAQFQFSEKPKGGVLFSKAVGYLLDKQFNDIIENKTGIESYKNYKRVKAQVTGASKGKFNFFIAPSAEDFVGLLYKTLGKGKLGDAQMAWYKENLLDPYARAMEKVSRDRNFIARNFLAIKKELKIVPKNLKKKIPGEPFTQEQAIRVYIWNKKGSTIPEISENDSIYLTNFVENNKKLKTFADQVIALNGLEDYAKPGDSWITGTITTDMLEALNTTKRKKYLELWQQNVDEIFSEKNLNKLEAAFGSDYRKAMENILKRMKTGRNRGFDGDALTGRFVDWLTGATGAIMFFNTRSAVLQTISAVNFINFGDNNLFAAGKAFANQKQYWSDFKTLFNSDFLVERRDGLKINVNEADIADIAKEKGVRGLINKLLKLGFTPTQIADSFAIATGGATFYRNRIKSLVKSGMDPAAAEKQASRDFRETAEESQQSSRPDKISAQQAGPLGRVILAFANTPAQYARIIKKAASDIKNGRGDLKTNVSKIMYYGVAQNLIFNALQQALFAAMFDEDEEEVDEKTINIANGMADSILRGIGISGAIVSVVKNAALRWVKEEEKGNPKYENAILELTKISPPVSSKINKLRAAARSYSWDKKEMKEGGLSVDNPIYLAAGNVVSATTNIPLDRAVKKIQHVKLASDSDIDTYKRIFLLAGWSEWELGIEKPKKKKAKKSNRSTNRKSSRR